MNTETLRQIFKLPFDYTTYSREIVHRLFGCHDVVSRPEWLDTNAEGDQSFFIGQMDDADHRLLGFFYTRVADGGDVRRKRVGLRKLISPYLKYDVDGAIAVFDDGRHWRLSYICDLKEGSTSAKRFSYILGDENGQYKTPLERLEKVARLNGRLTLSDLRESFSVDALSDEFFDEYHLHYDRIVANLTQSYRRDVPWRVSADGTSDTRLHDYVKKMMGRIVFLHFLQKKGWLNDNPTFLRDLFLASPHQADFLEQVLEPLFFGIFNTEPEQREELFANEHWDKGLLKQWERLPYLNGGLFERDEVDKMNIRLPASLFNDLFTFLASYNFTVDENDPDDAEIGVDPEMLGKIFESLLEDNKAKGAFYTPKEIVRYMCKESLIAYLNEQCAMNNVQLSSAIRSFVENHELPGELEPYCDVFDRALREVKICDPAIGSGAFPMGLLNELWRCREALTNHDSCSLITVHRSQLKKEIIENNIYGVDIERGAIDIARLRFWLSIVVDSEEPQALPNFDYKFMQGNSLIESFEGVDLSRMMSSEGQHSSLGKGRQKAGANQLGIEFVSTDTKRNLQLMLREYFSLTDHVKKAEARREINDSVKNYIRQQDLRPEAVARLASLDPSANQEFFLWHTWFKDIFDKGGFDIVVGNPPYVVTKKADYPTYKWSSDLYKMFFELSISKLCKRNSIISLITPKFYLVNKEDVIIREYFIDKINVISLSTCCPFQAVTENVITLLKKDSPKDTIRYFDYDNNKELFIEFEPLDVNYCKTNKYREMVLGLPKKTIDILLKMYDRGVPLGSLTVSKRGAEVSKNFLRESVSGIPALIGADMKKYQIQWEDTYLPHYSDEYFRLADFFDNELIYLRRVDSMLEATISERIRYGFNKNVYGLKVSGGHNLKIKYILACINSKALDFYYKKKFSTKKTDVFPEIQTYLYEQLPIPQATKSEQDEIIGIVDQILAAKKSNSNADTSTLEREIDELVYGLYGLTEEEVKVVEGKEV